MIGMVFANLGAGAKKCMLWDLETRKLIHSIGMQNQGSVNVLQFDDNVCD